MTGFLGATGGNVVGTVGGPAALKDCIRVRIVRSRRNAFYALFSGRAVVSLRCPRPAKGGRSLATLNSRRKRTMAGLPLVDEVIP